MEYRVFDDTVVVRLDKGDCVVQSLLSVASSEGITLATVQGIGAVDLLDVGVFDLEQGDYNRLQYTRNHEINAIVGNLTTKDGAPYAHLHVTATNDAGMVVGGHLFEGRVSLTAELFVRRIAGKVERQYDDILGINRLHF